MQRFPRTLFAATFALVLTTVCQAQIGIKRKPLSLSLFLKPFQPQTVTPQLFGLLPENEYLQKEIKLTAAQKKRMREIEIQLTRVSTALRQPDVRKAVGVTDTQLKRFAKHRTEARKKAQKFGKEWAKRRDQRKKAKKRPTRKELAEFRKRAAAIDAEYDKAVFNELTRAQKERFEKLKGAVHDPRMVFNKQNVGRTTLYVFPTELFTQPFKRGTTPPKVFGVLADLEYLQSQLKLSESQKQRMKGIEVQLTRVSWALRDQYVQKAVSLSTAQIKRIHEMHGSYQSTADNLYRVSRALVRKKIRAAAASTDPKLQQRLGAEARAEMTSRSAKRETLSKELDKSVLALLTEAQKRVFRELKGKSIKPEKLFGSKAKRPDV